MRKNVDTVNHRVAGPGEDDVLERVHALMHLVRAHRHRAMQAGGHDLSHMESKVLAFFARHPGATQSELAAWLGRDKGQLARLVAGLRERGLLEEAAAQTDRRSIRLQATAEARAIHQAMRKHAGKLSESAVRGLDTQERRLLLELLGRVQANLQDDG